MNKKTITVISCILAIVVLWIVASGFTYQTSAYITDDFTVSDDGDEIRFSVSVGSSMGYVRGYKDEGGGEKPHYLKFYSTWGGFNSPIGAKTEYVLKLNQNDREIYVYNGDRGYTLSMEKNVETGEWHRVK